MRISRFKLMGKKSSAFPCHRPYATLNLQFKVDEIDTTRILVLVRYNNLPTYRECDVVRVLRHVKTKDGEHAEQPFNKCYCTNIFW